MKRSFVLYPSFLCVATFVGLVLGEETVPSPTARVLYQRTLRKADGGILTYQRIEAPPALPKAPSQPTNQESAPSQEVLANMLKPNHSVLLTANVYEGSLTELCWMYEGKACVAWSSVDFRLLAGGAEFEDEHVRLSFMPITQVITRAQHAARLSQWEAQGSTGIAPLWPQFPPETLSSVPAGMTAWYVLVAFDGDATEEDAACASMEALHSYVEAHRAALELRRSEFEARAAAEAASKAAEPSGSKNTIIQFWPGRSAAQQLQPTNSQSSNRGEEQP